MTASVTHVAVLGSTGSIGQSTLEVIAASEGRLKAVGLAANCSHEQICRQAAEFSPPQVVLADAQAAAAAAKALPDGVTLTSGPDALARLAAAEEVDAVVAAIVGRAGLESTWAALEAGKIVALANKETLVVAGSLAMQLAEKSGAKILPVDSEHSAIFQCLDAGRREDVKRIILTASGGPFRQHTQKQLENVTVDEALAHPTWEMGPKITVDSATMMNKALELIEARWLFDLPADRIDVVVHPQSIVHSLVEFVDGSVVAQLSPPDMKLPIQYALTYPGRCDSPAAKMDFTQAMQLDFEPPDGERFPAIELGREVARVGGTAGAVVNAANEAAVAEFLGGRLSFTQIVPACRAVLQSHAYNSQPTLAELTQLDAWARKEITKWTS